MDWFYVSDRTTVGPITDSEFQRLVSAGTIGADTAVWRPGMADWERYGALAADGRASAATSTDGAMSGTPGDAAAAAAPPAAALCSQCRRLLPLDEMLAWGGDWVCSACKPAFVQRLKEGEALAPVLRYGGFWIRTGARVIDGVILWVVNTLILMAFGLPALTLAARQGGESRDLAKIFELQALLFAIQTAIAATYEVLFLMRTGATPGKMALRLKVVRSAGGGLSFGRAVGRYFATVVSSLTLGIGYIIAGFDAQKRSLHDHMCDTRVLRT